VTGATTVNKPSIQFMRTDCLWCHKQMLIIIFVFFRHICLLLCLLLSFFFFLLCNISHCGQDYCRKYNEKKVYLYTNNLSWHGWFFCNESKVKSFSFLKILRVFPWWTFFLCRFLMLFPLWFAWKAPSIASSSLI